MPRKDGAQKYRPRDGDDAIHGPYWLRAHRDWRFWAVVFMMLAAMAIYLFTNDLAWRKL